MGENGITSSVRDSMKRLVYIDSVKGFAILAVVVGHIIAFFTNDLLVPNAHKVGNFIHSFQMPLFMFLSGMVFRVEKLDSTELFRHIRTRFVRLMLPFIGWMPFFCLFREYTPFQILKSPDKGLWFLEVLFLIDVFFYVAMFLSRYIHLSLTIIVMYVSLLLVVNFITGGFGLWFVAYYVPLFLLGVLFSKYVIPHEKLHILFLPVTASLYLLLFWNWKWGSFVEMHDILWNYAVAICATIFIILSMKALAERCSLSSLAFLGRETLGIYAVHFFPIWMLIDTFNMFRIPHNTIASVAVFLLTMLMGGGIIWALKHTRIMRIILLGK